MAHDPMAPGVGDIEVTCSLHEHRLENGQRVFLKKGQAYGFQGLQVSAGDYAGLVIDYVRSSLGHSGTLWREITALWRS